KAWCVGEVTLSRKGANSPTRLRSSGTKVRPRAGQSREPRADLEQQLEACRRELAEAREHLAEALEQQTATSEVLRVISSSPGELEPVFQAMLANATRLCEATFGNLYLPEGDGFRMAALHGAPPAYVKWRKHQPVMIRVKHPHSPLARLTRTKAVQHVPDLTTDQAYIERAPA